MPFLTPDESTGWCIAHIAMPNDKGVHSAFFGALSQTLKIYNWEQFGDLTPDETAQLFNQVILDSSLDCFVPICDETGAILYDDNGDWLYDDNG